MRNENDGAAGFGPQALQLVVQQIASLGVQRGKWLVHQQDIRLGRQRSRQCHTLPHASRKLMDIAVPELRKMDEAQIILHLLFALGFRDVLHLHAELDVSSNRQPGKQGRVPERSGCDRSRVHSLARHPPEPCPRSGGCRPAIKCSNVDLPQPEGPTMQRNSPGFTSRLMLSSASKRSPDVVL